MNKGMGRHPEDLFSLPDEVLETFARDVDRLFATLKSYPQPVRFPAPPIFVALSGMREGIDIDAEATFSLDRDTLRKITGNIAAKKDRAHALTLQEVRLLPNLLADPLLVIQDTKQSLVSVVELQNGYGKEYSAIIHLAKKWKGKTINEVASVYARENLPNWLSRNLEKIVYFKNEKSRESSLQSQTHARLTSLLGVGALKQLASNRSQSSYPAKGSVLNSDDIVNILAASRNLAETINYAKPHTVGQALIELDGLCPREAGRKIYAVTQGDPAQMPLIEASLAAVGYTIDHNCLAALKGEHPFVVRDALMRSIRTEPHTQTQSLQSKDKENTR